LIREYNATSALISPNIQLNNVVITIFNSRRNRPFINAAKQFDPVIIYAEERRSSEESIREIET
ncbi:25386_t:CDS:1, partial [Gigaspora rosea]